MSHPVFPEEFTKIPRGITGTSIGSYVLHREPIYIEIGSVHRPPVCIRLSHRDLTILRHDLTQPWCSPLPVDLPSLSLNYCSNQVPITHCQSRYRLLSSYTQRIDIHPELQIKRRCMKDYINYLKSFKTLEIHIYLRSFQTIQPVIILEIISV